MAPKVDGLNIVSNTKPLLLENKTVDNDKIEMFATDSIKINIDEIELSSQNNSNQVEEKSDNKKKWLIGAGIALGTLAIGVAGYLFCKKFKLSEYTKNAYPSKLKTFQLKNEQAQQMTSDLNSAKIVGYGVFPKTRSLNNIPATVDLTKISEKPTGMFPYSRKTIRETVNAFDDDLSKILKYNEITRPNTKFVVVNKSTSKISLYRNGKMISSFDIGVGETIGDSLNTVQYNPINKTFGSIGKTTPSGEFKTALLPNNCINKADYISEGNVNAILLKGVQHPADFNQNTSLALHQFPINDYNQRLEIVNSQLTRKGCSTGCINLKIDDFQTLAQQVPEGTSVYILPEETGNSLLLTELPNKRLWFKTQYNDNERNEVLNLAMKKYFNFS